ncbi:anti-repressor SinI family protein [Mesobacillus foraminis]|nr:anti-repressor SinI family protein [Mesobacillus foraminis]
MIMTQYNTEIEKLDTEWISLIKEALELGISETEIREFLQK